MANDQNPQISAQILSDLKNKFPGRISITRVEFRELLGFSPSLDCRLKKCGQYPRLLSFATEGNGRYQQILLVDLADWLSSTRVKSETVDPPYKDKPTTKRGRPVGSKNKPKKPKEEVTQEEESSPVPGFAF